MGRSDGDGKDAVLYGGADPRDFPRTHHFPDRRFSGGFWPNLAPEGRGIVPVTVQARSAVRPLRDDFVPNDVTLQPPNPPVVTGVRCPSQSTVPSKCKELSFGRTGKNQNT